MLHHIIDIVDELNFRKKDAEKIFAEAAAQNMTGQGYAWIVTEQVSKRNALTDSKEQRNEWMHEFPQVGLQVNINNDDYIERFFHSLLKDLSDENLQKHSDYSKCARSGYLLRKLNEYQEEKSQPW